MFIEDDAVSVLHVPAIPGTEDAFCAISGAFPGVGGDLVGTFTGLQADIGDGQIVGVRNREVAPCGEDYDQILRQFAADFDVGIDGFILLGEAEELGVRDILGELHHVPEVEGRGNVSRGMPAEELGCGAGFRDLLEVFFPVVVVEFPVVPKELLVALHAEQSLAGIAGILAGGVFAAGDDRREVDRGDGCDADCGSVEFGVVQRDMDHCGCSFHLCGSTSKP